MTDYDRCGNCHYWGQVYEQQGLCYLNPPTVVSITSPTYYGQSSIEIIASSERPVVYSGDQGCKHYHRANR